MKQTIIKVCLWWVYFQTFAVWAGLNFTLLFIFQLICGSSTIGLHLFCHKCTNKVSLIFWVYSCWVHLKAFSQTMTNPNLFCIHWHSQWFVQCLASFDYTWHAQQQKQVIHPYTVLCKSIEKCLTLRFWTIEMANTNTVHIDFDHSFSLLRPQTAEIHWNLFVQFHVLYRRYTAGNFSEANRMIFTWL